MDFHIPEENLIYVKPVPPIRPGRWFLQLTPRTPGGPGSVAIDLGDERPNWLRRFMLQTLLGFRITDGNGG
jgi:hypothetical protein